MLYDFDMCHMCDNAYIYINVCIPYGIRTETSLATLIWMCMMIFLCDKVNFIIENVSGC